MTNFQTANFQDTGDVIRYNGEFVARFKYAKRDKKHFLKFLAANFTTEEYFGMLAQGYTPVGALETKGYVSTTVKRILKDHGYPQTLAGRAEFHKAQRERMRAAA